MGEHEEMKGFLEIEAFDVPDIAETDLFRDHWE